MSMINWELSIWKQQKKKHLAVAADQIAGSCNCDLEEEIEWIKKIK